MRPITLSLAALALLLAMPIAHAQTKLRPPAVPLVTHDPYFSIWSCADNLTDEATRHWTRAKHPLTCLIRVDEMVCRVMGDEPKDLPALGQTGLTLLPTRTIYTFVGKQIALTLTFTTPALPDDLEVMARPVTYVTWNVKATDRKEHAVSVFLGAGYELAVHSPEQRVVTETGSAGALTTVRVGTEDQPVLERSGDDARIDWGYAYLAAPARDAAASSAERASLIERFVSARKSPQGPPTASQSIALTIQMGRVESEPVERFAMVAYDDIYAMNYFGRNLRAYWRRGGQSFPAMLEDAARQYTALRSRCIAFDAALLADIRKVGGEKYADLCCLAYRQAIAACKLAADDNGMPMLFPKENTSNGCVATVDVIFPMDPLFILISPALAKASLAPVLAYTASPLWKFRYAPHDLGTYPQATRQVYGSEDPEHEGDRMPVEESGNMIILLAAIAQEEGNADFASQYWPQVTQWAKYLEEKGFDPANQLCTDDFTGHLAHNANLSVKAIMALACYGKLCGMRGDADAQKRYLEMARDMAKKWVAAADDGDHFRLAFDKPGTWSQKYNMVWDRLLGLDVFPKEVVQKEFAFYLKMKDRYGLPLDNRQHYAKADWAIWTATLAENPADFQALADPVLDYYNVTPDRNPMTDLYWTKEGKEVAMHARPVVGGVFIRMLSDAAMWKRWAGKGKNVTGQWAPIPEPPTVSEVVPTSERAPIEWRYTTAKPADDWFAPAFDDSAWKAGPGGFGAKGTPGAAIGTEWTTPDIWLRRTFEMPAGTFKNLQLSVYHDEDVEVYVNGVLAGRASGFVTRYTYLAIRPAALATLKPGKNTIAVHCRQTAGGQGVDVGLVDVEVK